MNPPFVGQYSLPFIDLTDPARGRSSSNHVHHNKVSEKLAAMRQLADELNAELYRSSEDRPVVSSPGDIAHILQPPLSVLDHEELWVVNLDTRNRVKSVAKLYQGSVNSSQVRLAEIFRQAIIENAPSLVVAHNHPSGDPLPSPDDVAITKAIVQAGKLLDIDVLDHLVIGLTSFVSLKERGLGFG